MKSTGTIIAAIFGFIFAYLGIDFIEHGTNNSNGIIYKILSTYSSLIGIVLLLIAAGFLILATIGIVKRLNSKK